MCAVGGDAAVLYGLMQFLSNRIGHSTLWWIVVRLVNVVSGVCFGLAVVTPIHLEAFFFTSERAEWLR